MANSQRDQTQSSSKPWSNREAYLLSLVCLFVGVIVGYLLRGSSPTGTAAPAQANTQTTASAPAPSLQSPEALNPLIQPMLDALKLDPRNFENLVSIANAYYDHKFYAQAIPYYQRALEVRPNEVNVRTDMGTAYYYTGAPEKAIEEFQKSLTVSPKHPQTLFNMGVVKMDGLKDPRGAISAWETLLRTDPSYPQRDRVEQLIAQAKAQKK